MPESDVSMSSSDERSDVQVSESSNSDEMAVVGLMEPNAYKPGTGYEPIK